MPQNVDITDKVFMDVRIARKDGSTYVRDDLDDSFENTVLFQRIRIGLYGKQAPNHKQKFLSYIDTPSTTAAEDLRTADCAPLQLSVGVRMYCRVKYVHYITANLCPIGTPSPCRTVDDGFVIGEIPAVTFLLYGIARKGSPLH